MATINDTNPDAQTSVSTGTEQPTVITTNALVLDGDLTMNWSNLDTCDHDGVLTMEQVSNDRFTGVRVAEPTYYIRAGYDINSHILFNAGGNEDESDSTTRTPHNDDAWKIDTAINVNYVTNHDSAGNDTGVTYKLPHADVTYDVAKFTVNDPLGRQQIYNVELNIVMGNDSAVSANASLDTATSFTGIVDDDHELAQYAYWPVSGHTVPSGIAVNDHDKLADTITSAEVDTHFTATGAMGNLEQEINDVNYVLESYTISFDATDFLAGSNLSQFAQSLNDSIDYTSDDTAKKVFAENDRIVTSGNQLYAVTLTATGDHAATHTLVNDYVYGVLQQTSSGAR